MELDKQGLECRRAVTSQKVCGEGGETSDPSIADMLRESDEAKWLMVHTEVEGGRSTEGGTEGLKGDGDDWMAWMAEDWCRDWRPTHKPIKKQSVQNLCLER